LFDPPTAEWKDLLARDYIRVCAEGDVALYVANSLYTPSVKGNQKP
jgi:hypothetical protein